MNGACRQWQVQAWWLSLVAHQLTVRNQPESGGQPSVVDPEQPSNEKLESRHSLANMV